MYSFARQCCQEQMSEGESMKIQALPLPYVAFLLVAISLLMAAYRDQQQDIALLKAQADMVPLHRQLVKKLEQRLESSDARMQLIEASTTSVRSGT